MILWMSILLNMRSRLISLIEKNDHEARIPLDLLLIAKYLERIADHSCNVANWINFRNNRTSFLRRNYLKITPLALNAVKGIYEVINDLLCRR